MKTHVDTFVILSEQKGNKQLIASKEKSNHMMCMCQ